MMLFIPIITDSTLDGSVLMSTLLILNEGAKGKWTINTLVYGAQRWVK